MGRRVFWWHRCAVRRRLVVSFCGQAASCLRTYYPATWHWPASPNMDTAQQVPTFSTAGKGRCRACLHKWGLVPSDLCDCSHQQTINHIVDTCQLTKFEDGRTRLYMTDGDTANWLKTLAMTAFAKCNEEHCVVVLTLVWILQMHVCLPGYVALRHKDYGSQFIRCLVYVFSRKAHVDHVMDMLVEVNITFLILIVLTALYCTVVLLIHCVSKKHPRHYRF